MVYFTMTYGIFYNESSKARVYFVSVVLYYVTKPSNYGKIYVT